MSKKERKRARLRRIIAILMAIFMLSTSFMDSMQVFAESSNGISIEPQMEDDSSDDSSPESPDEQDSKTTEESTNVTEDTDTSLESSDEQDSETTEETESNVEEPQQEESNAEKEEQSDTKDEKEESTDSEGELLDNLTVEPSTVSVSSLGTQKFTVPSEWEEKVKWSVEGNTSEHTSIDNKGLLTVGVDETGELKVTATSIDKARNSETQKAVAKVKINPIDFSPGSYFTADGYEWQVLKNDGKNALIITKDIVGTSQFRPDISSNAYEGSTLETEMKDFYTNNLNTLKSYALPVNLPASGPSITDRVDVTTVASSGTPTAFALSTADVLTSTEAWPTILARIARLNGGVSVWWLRSRSAVNANAQVVNGVGDISSTSIVTNNRGVRPALYIDLESLKSENLEIIVSPSSATMKPLDTQQFEAVAGVWNIDKRSTPSMNWTVEGATSSETRIDENGLLTLGLDEKGNEDGKLTVKVQLKDDPEVSAKVIVTVGESIDFSPGSYFTADGYEWQVLKNDGKNALIITKDIVKLSQFRPDTSSNAYEGSTLETEMKNFYTNNLNILKTYALPVNLPATEFNQGDRTNVTTVASSGRPIAFALSAADVNTSADAWPSNASRIGYYNENASEWWLRSPDGHNGMSLINARVIRADGTFWGRNFTDTHGVRPALYINLESTLVEEEAGLWFEKVPSNIEFEDTSYQNKLMTINRKDPSWSMSIKDTRKSGSTWEVHASVESPLETKDGKQLLGDNIAFKNDEGQMSKLNSQPQKVFSGTKGEETITELSWDKDEGILLHMNPLTAQAEVDEEYATTITWTLMDVWSPDPDPDPELTITPTEAEVQAGGEKQFTALFGIRDVTNTATWSVNGTSSNTKIVNGKLTVAVDEEEKELTVTVKHAGVTKTATVTVKALPLTAITIEGPSALNPQEIGDYTVVADNTAENLSIKWSVTGGGTNSSIDQNGKYKAGLSSSITTATITATVEGTNVTATKTVTVRALTLAIDGATGNLNPQETRDHTVKTNAVGNVPIKWSVTGGGTNSSIDQNGKYKAGVSSSDTTATITATVEGTTATATKTVTVRALTFEMDSAPIILNPQEIWDFTVTSNAVGDLPIKWSLESGGGEENSSIDQNGKFKAGLSSNISTVRISATVEGTNISAEHDMLIRALTLTINGGTLYLDPQQTNTYRVTSNAVGDFPIKWSVTGGGTNSSIDQDGKYKAGLSSSNTTATITATVEGMNVSVRTTVTVRALTLSVNQGNDLSLRPLESRSISVETNAVGGAESLFPMLTFKVEDATSSQTKVISNGTRNIEVLPGLNERGTLTNGRDSFRVFAELTTTNGKVSAQTSVTINAHSFKAGTTFEADGYTWRVLRNDGKHAMIVTEDLIGNTVTPSGVSARLNDFYNGLSTLKNYALPVVTPETPHTVDRYDSRGYMTMTTVASSGSPRAFLLSGIDISTSVSAWPTDASRAAGRGAWWVRAAGNMTTINSIGSFSIASSGSAGLRPALYIDLEMGNDGMHSGAVGSIFSESNRNWSILKVDSNGNALIISDYLESGDNLGAFFNNLTSNFRERARAVNTPEYAITTVAESGSKKAFELSQVDVTTSTWPGTNSSSDRMPYHNGERRSWFLRDTSYIMGSKVYLAVMEDGRFNLAVRASAYTYRPALFIR